MWWRPGFDWPEALKFGSVPEWLEAFGTIAAFGATFVLLLHEVNRARALGDERRRDPAASVAAWVEVRGNEVTDTEGKPRRITVDWTLLVSNASKMLVQNCEVVVAHPRPDSGIQEAKVYVGTIPPGRTRELTFPWPGMDEWDLAPSVAIATTFMDSRGSYWIRTAGGELREVPGPPESTC